MSKKKTHEKPPITKKSKSRRFKIFKGHKEKEAESATDDIYEDVKFFVNSTSILLTPREKFAEKATVTRLSVADHNKFLALIDVNNTGIVIVTEMDGVVQNTCNLTAPIEVVVLDDNRVAVLHGQVAILKRGEEEVKETKAMTMDISVKDVTGFDYSRSRKEFAVSSISKVTILNETGKVRKKLESVAKHAHDTIVLTKFDFPNTRLLILKVTPDRKSVKCYSFKSKTFLWSFLCSEEEFSPRAMVKHINKLFILCR